MCFSLCFSHYWSLILHADTPVSVSVLSVLFLGNSESNSISDIFPFSLALTDFFFFSLPASPPPSHDGCSALSARLVPACSHFISLFSGVKFLEDHIEFGTQPRSINFGSQSQLRGTTSNFWTRFRPSTPTWLLYICPTFVSVSA